MCNSVQRTPDTMPVLSRFLQVIIFLIFVSTVYLVLSFTPLTKEEQIKSFDKMNEYAEPFRKDLTECARQVKASQEDVQNFLRQIPQNTFQGKCFVACILKRNAIITSNKINRDNLLKANKDVFGENSEVWTRLQKAVAECMTVVDKIFEICEYASIFNDCMHMKLEYVMDKAAMERRMEALGQMTADPDTWSDEEDEMLKLLKDEL